MELSAEKLTDMIFEFYKKTEKMLVLKLYDAGEIELLKRKLPQEIVDEHLQDDTYMIEKMIALFHVKKEGRYKCYKCCISRNLLCNATQSRNWRRTV